MATPMMKTTYSLDLGTVRSLERMAKRWKVTKSEALRRAVRIAEEQGSTGPVEALDELQRSLGLTPARTKEWLRDNRNERRTGSAKRERG